MYPFIVHKSSTKFIVEKYHMHVTVMALYAGVHVNNAIHSCVINIKGHNYHEEHYACVQII